MAEMVRSHAEKSDEEIAVVMLERLSRDNYIPGRAMEEYASAFVHEFRKFTGQAFEDDGPLGLEIKILGMGCVQCDSLAQTVMEILTELNLPASLDHITDIKEIARYGVMGTPALLINGRTVAVGRVPPRKQITAWLIDAKRALAGKV
jgi:hypothetical protein